MLDGRDDFASATMRRVERRRDGVWLERPGVHERDVVNGVKLNRARSSPPAA